MFQATSVSPGAHIDLPAPVKVCTGVWPSPNKQAWAPSPAFPFSCYSPTLSALHTHTAYTRLLCHAHTHRCTCVHSHTYTYTLLPSILHCWRKPSIPWVQQSPWSSWDLHMLPRASARTLSFLAPPSLTLLKFHSRVTARARGRTLLVTCPPD